MITATELERLRASCGCGVDLEPAVAEYLEGRASWAWDRADLFGDEAANEGAQAIAANQSGSPAQRPRPGLYVAHWVRLSGMVSMPKGVSGSQHVSCRSAR